MLLAVRIPLVAALLIGLLAPLETRAQFILRETGGTFRTDAPNLAAATNGATAFGKNELGFGIHFITTINDGTYGNSSSWIGAAGSESWVGVYLATPSTIASIAYGRDNNGVYTDRSLNPTRIEYTTSSLANATEQAAAVWRTIGILDYYQENPGSPARRHLYDLATPLAGVTGFRLRAYGDANAYDELELYSTAYGVAAVPEPSTYAALAGLAALGLAMWRRGRARGAR